MLTTLNNKIREAFSRSADRYDILASLHREIGREMMHKVIDAPCVDRILDIGCGTGYVAHKANVYFPHSHVIALDFAAGMIEQAKTKYQDINWVLADARALPFKQGSIDLVVSNLAYQWIDPLEESFKHLYQVLSPKGSVAITLFGSQTCKELIESLATVGVVAKRQLPTFDEVNQAMKDAGFRNITSDYERINIQFDSMMELLGWLKAIGANHLNTDNFLGKQKLAQAQEYYRAHFPYHHGVSATFEVIWLKAER